MLIVRPNKRFTKPQDRCEQELARHRTSKTQPTGPEEIVARDELSQRRLDANQIMTNIETCAVATLLFGHSVDILPNGVEFNYSNSPSLTSKELADLESIELPLNRDLVFSPGWSRLPGRVAFKPLESAREVAINTIGEAIDAIREIDSRECFPDYSDIEFDHLGAIEHFEINVLPQLKEIARHQSAAPYQRYLRTEHWKRTRQRALKRSGNQCGLCSATKRLQVHHKTYVNFWDEHDEDLVVLCRQCHARFHGKLADG